MNMHTIDHGHKVEVRTIDGAKLTIPVPKEMTDPGEIAGHAFDLIEGLLNQAVDSQKLWEAFARVGENRSEK